MPSRVTSLAYPCPKCCCWLKNKSRLTQHLNVNHPALAHPPVQTNEQRDVFNEATNGKAHNADWFPQVPSPRSSPAPDVETKFFGPREKLYRNYHILLNSHPCDTQGAFLPEGTPPPPLQESATNDWSPFGSWMEFELADFLFTCSQMPGTQIDALLDIWAASLIEAGSQPLFSHDGNTCIPGHKDIYQIIDHIKLGDVKWDSFTVQYTGDHPANGAPTWMNDRYDIFFQNPHKVVQNILGNPSFSSDLDLRPYREFVVATGERQWCNFMYDDWAWNQADVIARDPATHGSVFVPVILGSDKTTNALVLIGFLAMPKTMKVHAKTSEFQQFHRQLFHSSLSLILQSLKQFMTNPDVVRFGDGHYRRAIYGLGPYIADYEEEVLLVCIVRSWCAKCLTTRQDLDTHALYCCQEHTELLITQLAKWFGLGHLWDQYGIVGELVPFTNDFPLADIHELLALDLLHQIIKGAFKDHFMEWVERYLRVVYGADADAVLDDIDHQIATVAPFSGLRGFPQGCHFKQWTGDDSKALMKQSRVTFRAMLYGHCVPFLSSVILFIAMSLPTPC
ncbi:hypothetical protein V8E55_006988 [Tylopilus felleus]